MKASRKDLIHNFIISQSKGYDTVVVEKGSNLSCGQKQMISIARAMLKNASIQLYI